jgi:hypothetical protein
MRQSPNRQTRQETDCYVGQYIKQLMKNIMSVPSPDAARMGDADNTLKKFDN